MSIITNEQSLNQTVIELYNKIYNKELYDLFYKSEDVYVTVDKSYKIKKIFNRLNTDNTFIDYLEIGVLNTKEKTINCYVRFNIEEHFDKKCLKLVSLYSNKDIILNTVFNQILIDNIIIADNIKISDSLISYKTKYFWNIFLSKVRNECYYSYIYSLKEETITPINKESLLSKLDYSNYLDKINSYYIYCNPGTSINVNINVDSIVDKKLFIISNEPIL